MRSESNRLSAFEPQIMSHKEMFLRYIAQPIAGSMQGIFDSLSVKLVFLAGSIPALLSFDLFQTPQAWWQGLLYLVIMDWVGGVVTSVHRGKFNFRVMTKKWYQVTGYVLVCGSAAILSNTFQVFYYFQFIVYATFFLKEWVSILRTFKLLALFQVTWEAFVSKKLDISQFSKFKEEIDRCADAQQKADEENELNYL